MNIAEHLQAAAERHPTREALVAGHRRVTYRELRATAAGIAGGLQALGITPGDRVACALKNRYEAAVLYFGCQWLGAPLVPINWRAKPDEVRYQIEDSGARLFASDSHHEAPSGCVQIGIAGGGGIPFEDLLGAPELTGPNSADERDLALMLYTSGTTGRPKGVPRSAKAERAAALSHVIQCGYRDGERTLLVMPLYHTMGMRSLLAMTCIGGTSVIATDWQPAAMLDLIETESISSLYLAPTLFHDLCDEHERRPAGGVCPVRCIAYAGAPMTEALVERVVATFSPDVFVNHYGSTEIYTYTVHADQRAKPGCAGRPGINARIRLVEPVPDATAADEVQSGEVGQVICHLSHDEAFHGYWNRSDADARQIRDGWFFTGDLGQLDGDGDLNLVGRIDDMIISGGENVHPLEVEACLAQHPAVSDCAVVGLDDARFGQRVTAYVICRFPVSESELDQHCLASPTLSAFKRPREYHFLDALPRNPSGKILRRLLRPPAEGRSDHA